MCCSKKFPLYLFSLCILLTLSILALSLNADRSVAQESLSGAQVTKSSGEAKVSDKLLRHVVLFQFKESSSADDIKKVVEAFRELPQKIQEIADFEWGTNNSPEGLSDGLTHGFIVSFKSEKDRDVYLDHPAHKAFVEVLLPHLQKPVVIDFWATK